MAIIKTGDIVARKSYNKDIYFRVAGFANDRVLLKGIDVRLLADSPPEDLVKIAEEERKNYEDTREKDVGKTIDKILKRRQWDKEKNMGHGTTRSTKNDLYEHPGTILHLDGDGEYLQRCVKQYEKLGLSVHGEVVEESRQPEVVVDLVKKYNPDIIVLTGHDAIIKGKNNWQDLNNYRNSRYFIDAVQRVRSIVPYKDELVIFAGACQSFYEEILSKGANFASAPKRILINIFDPVYVAERIASSSIQKTVQPNEVVAATVSGIEGIGGLETRGKLRIGYPALVK